MEVNHQENIKNAYNIEYISPNEMNGTQSRINLDNISNLSVITNNQMIQSNNPASDNSTESSNTTQIKTEEVYVTEEVSFDQAKQDELVGKIIMSTKKYRNPIQTKNVYPSDGYVHWKKPKMV